MSVIAARASGARHLIALARGCRPGAGCWCASCGASPYDAEGPAKRRIGGNFTDHALLLAPSAQSICLGCASLLAGRPSRTDPPLRMLSGIATVSGWTTLSRAGCWEALLAPHGGEHVLLVTARARLHASLRAGISTPERLLVGTEGGTIDYVPDEHAGLARAVLELRSACTTEEIASGQYRPYGMRRLGIERWRQAEALTAAYRGGALLPFLAWLAPKTDPPEPEEDEDMIDPSTERAALLIARLSRACSARGRDGKSYWGGLLVHRLRRYGRLPLESLVSRLMADLGVSVVAPTTATALAELRAWDDATASAVGAAIQQRPDLVAGLAYTLIKDGEL